MCGKESIASDTGSFANAIPFLRATSDLSTHLKSKIASGDKLRVFNEPHRKKKIFPSVTNKEKKNHMIIPDAKIPDEHNKLEGIQTDLRELYPWRNKSIETIQATTSVIHRNENLSRKLSLNSEMKSEVQPTGKKIKREELNKKNMEIIMNNLEFNRKATSLHLLSKKESKD